VIGVGEDYLGINNDSLRKGRNFRSTDIRSGRSFAIIGSVVASDLFDESKLVVGRELKIGTTIYTVIGILNDKSRDFLASIGSVDGDPNNRILVPYTQIQREMGMKDIDQIQASALSLERADDAAEQLVKLLERRHRFRFTYRSETMAQYVVTANRILGGVTLVGVVAASISLLVGGMGIMNIMGTSVLERTREIGLRKALGAHRSDIRFQFLIESATISVMGGFIGVAVGLGITAAANLVSPFTVTPSLLATIGALAISAAIGMLSGYLPAQRAARLHPVVALRYE